MSTIRFLILFLLTYSTEWLLLMFGLQILIVPELLLVYLVGAYQKKNMLGLLLGGVILYDLTVSPILGATLVAFVLTAVIASFLFHVVDLDITHPFHIWFFSASISIVYFFLNYLSINVLRYMSHTQYIAWSSVIGRGFLFNILSVIGITGVIVILSRMRYKKQKRFYGSF